MRKRNLIRMLLAVCLVLPLLLQCIGVCGAFAAGKSNESAEPEKADSEAVSAGERTKPADRDEEAGEDADDGGERDLTPLPDEWFDDALFLGDSITATLQAWCTVHEAFGDALFLPARSYSVQRDIFPVRQIVYKAQYWTAHEVVAEIGAKKLFLMVGMNDISSDNGVENTMLAWEEFVPQIRENAPDVQIFIQSLIPSHWTADEKGLGNEKIDCYNSELRSFCEENDCVYVDIAPYLKDSDNNLREEYSYDRYVHLNDAGAEIWAEQLKNPANYSVDPRSADDE